MELHLVEKTADSILFSIKDSDMTVITPLINRLIQREDVVDVQFTDRHPELEDPRLMVIVKGADPASIVKETAMSISKDFEAARNMLAQ